MLIYPTCLGGTTYPIWGSRRYLALIPPKGLSIGLISRGRYIERYSNWDLECDLFLVSSLQMHNCFVIVRPYFQPQPGK